MPKIKFENLGKGIAESPIEGTALLKNLNTNSYDGALKLNLTPELAAISPTEMVDEPFTSAYEVDLLFFTNDPDVPVGTAVEFETTGTLPSPLATGTTYYLITVGSTGNYKVATTLANALAGTSVTLTDDGSGTHTGTATLPSLITHFIDDGADIWAVDDNNRVWKREDSPSVHWLWYSGNGSGFGYGAVYWHDYLLVSRSQEIETYGPISGSASWYSSFESIDSNQHQMFIGADDVVYITNGNEVASLMENSGSTFDPTDSGTYTFNTAALDLPNSETVKCFSELGTYLFIGTDSGKIYTWDRISSSYDIPLQVDNGEVQMMIAFKNLVYIFTSGNGKIYVTNGSSVEKIAQLPEFYFNVDDVSYYYQARSITDGKIWFAPSVVTSGPAGIWSLEPTGKLVFEYQTSNGNTDGDVIRFGAVTKDRFSYEDTVGGDSYYGIDEFSSYTYSDYDGICETQMVDIGTSTQPTTLNIIQINLAEDLASGDGVRLKWRKSTDDDWTTIGTLDYATNGAVSNYLMPYSITSDKIQLRIELTASAISGGSPIFKSIILS